MGLIEENDKKRKGTTPISFCTTTTLSPTAIILLRK